MTDAPAADWSDDEVWERRLREDRERAQRHQTAAQRAITATLLERSIELGARGFALTGSTARARRTEISDLDYHVIGRRPDVRDQPADVDVVAHSLSRFEASILAGDDFAQWTIRHGCILFDTGVLRRALIAVSTRGLWPDPQRKFGQLHDLRREAERLIIMGDRDAAQDQLRAALTTAARGLLLGARVFPLARIELVEQLRVLGHGGIAEALRMTIAASPELDELRLALEALDAAMAAPAA